MRAALLSLAGLIVATEALAQRAGDNAVTAAEDAFGATIGNESVGLYSPSSVRGFSPIIAGNVRIEGIYFDRQGYTSPRFTPSSAIRVGLTAQGYLFPAPTGIVDYSLQRAGDTQVISAVGGLNPYASPFLEVDGKFPLIKGRLGVSAGVSAAREEYYDGSDALYYRVGIVPRWRPREGVEILPFFAMTKGFDEKAPPTVRTSGDFLPPEIQRRRYFGQDWATKDSTSWNYGVVSKARLGENWSLAGGVFRSIFETERGFADLYLETAPNGLTRERLVADPGQKSASTSGEARVSRSFREGPRLHVLSLSYRARSVPKTYGGSQSFDYPVRPLGQALPAPMPRFAYGARTHDEVRQTTFGLAYEGRWRDLGEISLGAQKVDYTKEIAQPGRPVALTKARPGLATPQRRSMCHPSWPSMAV